MVIYVFTPVLLTTLSWYYEDHLRLSVLPNYILYHYGLHAFNFTNHSLSVLFGTLTNVLSKGLVLEMNELRIGEMAASVKLLADRPGDPSSVATT